MYQSTRDQLIQSKKESANKRLISSDIDQMVRNQMIMQGQPIMVENEEPSIEQERAFIITQLKSITNQPIKFYNYLYRTNQITDFSLGINEFIKKKLRYKRNIPYDSLVKEWESYKIGEMSVTPLDSMLRKNIYNRIAEPRLNLNKKESENRLELEKEEMEGRERKKDLYDIGKTLINLKAPPPPPPPKMRISKQTQEVPPLSSIDKLMEELKDKIKYRKMEGIGMRKGKKNTHVIGLLINPTKMTHSALYPVNRNWSWM